MARLHHIEKGTGEALVFIHGFPENKDIWKRFIEHLGSERVRSIAVDLPGFGENPPLEMPHTITDFAEQVNQTLEQLGVQSCFLVGHSLGGYVSLAFAEKFPQKVKGLIMFHSTALSDSLEKKQGRNRSIDFIERYGVREFVEEFVTPLFYEGRKAELKEHIQYIADMGKATSQRTIVETIKAMRDRKDRTKVLEKATYPVLFIVGRNDLAVNLSTNTSQFWLAPTSSVHILNETGHMGMFERQEVTLRIVENFIYRILDF